VVSLRGLHPQLRPYAEALVQLANRDYGLRVNVTSTLRSYDQQQRLYQNYLDCKARGLAGTSVSLGAGLSCAWPANPPGQSGHNYGLAWDSTADDMATWTALRRWAGWHVPENDQIHAELPGWRQYVPGLT